MPSASVGSGCLEIAVDVVDGDGADFGVGVGAGGDGLAGAVVNLVPKSAGSGFAPEILAWIELWQRHSTSGREYPAAIVSPRFNQAEIQTAIIRQFLDDLAHGGMAFSRFE